MGNPYESWKDFIEPLFDIYPELIDMDNEAQVEFLRDKGMINDDAYNTGGRVGLQEGGQTQYEKDYAEFLKAKGDLPAESITTTDRGPALEAMMKGFGQPMMDNLATPILTTGGTNQYGQKYGSFLPQAQIQNQLQQQAMQQMLNQQGYGQAQFDNRVDAQGNPIGTGGFTGIQGMSAASPYGTLAGGKDATGIAGYQKYLDRAATDLKGASDAAAAGQGAGTGALGKAQTAYNAAQQAAAAGQNAGAQYMGPSSYQQFMDPYQQEVMDTSLAQFDERAGQQQAQAGLAATKAGAFGGSRFGVQEGSRQAQSNLDRASMSANMLSQGYQQAKQAAANAFQQANAQALQNMNMYGQAGQGQLGLAGAQQGQAAQNVGLYQTSAQGQQGMAQLQPQLVNQGIGALGQFGSQQQQQGQAILDTQAKGNQMTAFQPQQGLGFFGGQLAGLMQGYGTPNTFTSAAATPGSSPMSMMLTGIGAGANLGNMFGGWGG